MNLEELGNTYLAAERAITRCEAITGKVSLPALSELRYAGYHMAKAFAHEMHDTESELVKASHHCLRAWRDTYETTLIYLLEQVDAVVKESRGNWQYISSALPNLPELLDKTQFIRHELIDLKTTDEPISRRIDWFEENITTLLDIHRKLYALAPIAETMASKERFQRLSNTRNAVAVIIGLIGLIAAILSVIGGIH